MKGGWSNSRLEAEIAREFGPRRAGGRRRKVPADKADVLVQLEQMCTTWARWRASLGLARDDGARAVAHPKRCARGSTRSARRSRGCTGSSRGNWRGRTRGG